jgi:CheY-like chemotaxis protein/nitrogen-specific signal transduction histidine kinase
VLDVHEQKKQELALEEAHRAAQAAAAAKSNFLASMSHEIRTPLNGVLGMAQSLHGDHLTDAQREKVSIILDSGTMLMALLNDVLDLSKVEAGKLEITPVDDDLRDSIGRAAMLFRPVADEKGIVLDIDVDEAVPRRLRFDPVRVRQCVSNLFSNAIKFTETGGRVVLRLETGNLPDGGYLVTITISDTGIGMSQETLSKLFSHFVQADESTSRRFGGTGLGLAISRQLARAMGGDIDVTSEYGKGSSFRLSFLADPAAIARTGAETGKPAPGHRPAAEASGHAVLADARVLLVDDNQVNRQVIKLFLAPCSVYISEAVNGLDALETLRRAKFDIVLLDVHMPVMDGCEAIKAIRASGEAWRDVPVIALTADAMSGDKERYLAIGMTDYVAKPVDQRELISKMCAILAARGEAASPERAAASG